LLEGLVREYLKEHGGDPGAGLTAAGALAPSYDFLFSIGDPDVRETLGSVRLNAERSAAQTSLPPTEDWTGAATGAGEPPSGGGRFRILRMHGKGGPGIVYVALDLELGREVALKEIRGDAAYDPGTWSRFLFEAEVNGKLEHPSIVPVYGRGRYEDG